MYIRLYWDHDKIIAEFLNDREVVGVSEYEANSNYVEDFIRDLKEFSDDLDREITDTLIQDYKEDFLELT